MIKKIKELISKIRIYFSYSACYSEMEAKGKAAMSNCCGLSGGDRGSNYLNYSCMSCPYLTLVYGDDTETDKGE